MAIHPTLASAASGFAERGRTVVQTYSVDLVEMSHRPAFAELMHGADGITHLDVITADGPFGPEVLIQARAGDVSLPGELYCQVPGAFGAPAAFGKVNESGLAWVSPNEQLQDYLRTHQFGAPALPGGQRSGQREINLAWTLQLNALGADQSIMVCQLSGDDPTAVSVALAIVDHVSKVTTQSRAAGPQDTLYPLRFGFVVGLALTDQLVVAPPPTVANEDVFDTSARSWEAPTASAGSIDATAKVAEALGRYEGKRVCVGPISEPKKLANVLRGIAPAVDIDQMCGFVDTGARANGKSGVVFTPSALYFNGVGGRHHFEYSSIESFQLESASVVITVNEGQKVKIPSAGQSLPIAEVVAAVTGLTV